MRVKIFFLGEKQLYGLLALLVPSSLEFTAKRRIALGVLLLSSLLSIISSLEFTAKRRIALGFLSLSSLLSIISCASLRFKKG